MGRRKEAREEQRKRTEARSDSKAGTCGGAAREGTSRKAENTQPRTERRETDGRVGRGQWRAREGGTVRAAGERWFRAH